MHQATFMKCRSYLYNKSDFLYPILSLVMADQLFEGCLLLDEKDKKLLSGASGKDGKRTHVSLKEKMWPSNDIPYTVDSLYRKKSDRGCISAFFCVSSSNLFLRVRRVCKFFTLMG